MATKAHAEKVKTEVNGTHAEDYRIVQCRFCKVFHKEGKPCECASIKGDEVKPWLTVEALRKYDDETLERVNARQVLISEATYKSEDADAIAKAAKASLKAQYTGLADYIETRRGKRGKPPTPDLFAGQSPDAAPSDADAKSYNGRVHVDAWKLYPIDELTDLPPAVRKALAEGKVKKGTSPGPILTMGDLAEFTAPHPNSGYCRAMSDIAGMGPEKVSKIDDATEAFWKMWNSGGDAKFAREMALDNPAKYGHLFRAEGEVADETQSGANGEMPSDGDDDNSMEGDSDGGEE